MKRWHYLAAAVAVAVLSVAVPLPAVAMLAIGFAGSTTQITDVDAALKLIADGSVIRNVVTDSELLDLFAQDSNVQVDKTTGGRYIERAQQFKLGGAVGFRKDGEYIPVPGVGDVRNSKIYLKKAIGVVEMSGDVMRRAKGDVGAYMDWAEQELPNLVERLTNVHDRVTLGFGAGALARVLSVAGSPTITLKDAHGVAGYGNAWVNFLEGDKIVFSATITGATLRNAGASQSATVVSVDQDANSITIDALPTGVVANDYIFMGDGSGASSQDASGDDREYMGLLGMVDDGTILATLQGLARTVSQQWKSLAIDATASITGHTSGVLDEAVIGYADDEQRIKGGGKGINAFVASLSGGRSFWNSLKTDRVLNDPKTFTGGRKGLTMLLGDRAIEVRAARKMPPQVAFGLSTPEFTRHMLEEFEWDQTTGAIWRQVTDSTGRKDAFYAYGCQYLQLSVRRPRRSFVIRSLTAS
jgi:hypothetical protein